MKAPAIRALAVAVGVAASATSAHSQATFAQNMTMRIELVGLSRWSLAMINDSLGKYAPADSLLSHACAAVLRDKLHFADASAVYYGERDGREFVVVSVVEPQDSALVKYRQAFRDSQPDKRAWKAVKTAFLRHNQAFQTAMQRPAFLLSNARLSAGDSALRPVLPLRTMLHRQRTKAAQRGALRVLAIDGNQANRIGALTILSQFADSDSTWFALMDALRDPDGPVTATATQILAMLTQGAARPVDWTPAVSTLRALLDGTDLFAPNQVMETLAATRVSPALAASLLRGGGKLVLAKLDTESPSDRQAAHRFMVQIAGSDLGAGGTAWKDWLTRL